MHYFLYFDELHSECLEENIKNRAFLFCCLKCYCFFEKQPTVGIDFVNDGYKRLF